VRPALERVQNGGHCGSWRSLDPGLRRTRRPLVELLWGTRKSPGPGSSADPGRKTPGRKPARRPITHHPKPMGQWRARRQCPTPTKVTPSKTPCLGLFRALRCTIAVIFTSRPKLAANACKHWVKRTLASAQKANVLPRYIGPDVSAKSDASRHPHPFRTRSAWAGSIGTGQLAAGLDTDPTPCFLRDACKGPWRFT
jgi:hypothetical protein